MVQVGLWVLLVDCDLRRGYLYSIFFQVEGYVGFVDYFLVNVVVFQVIEEIEYQGVDFIGWGRMVNNFVELFMMEKFQIFVDVCLV